MGNKSTSPPKGPDAGKTNNDGAASMNDVTGSVSGDGAAGPSPELLASLQSLGDDDGDYTLLPHSLHQIAEAYSLKEDYQWAIQFLQLEKLYHQRLLSNLTALQENWESQWREKENSVSTLTAEAHGIGQKHMETLSRICRTHLRPSVSGEQNVMLGEIQSADEKLQSCRDRVSKPETPQQDDEREPSMWRFKFRSARPPAAPQRVGGEEEKRGEEAAEGEEEGETYEEGQEVGVEEEAEPGPCEDSPEEEEVKVEWPTGVPQASDKDLAKLSNAEGATRIKQTGCRTTEASSSPDGLVSILKRRRASLDGLPPPSSNVDKQSSKRKVRFSEPEDGAEQDEVGGDSCLILLLLCLVTVVISVGGTALYCTLVGTYSNICTDFAQNVDFYVTNVRGFFEGLGNLLPLWT